MKTLLPEATLSDLLEHISHEKSPNPKFLGMRGFNLVIKDKVDAYQKKMTISPRVYADLGNKQRKFLFFGCPTKSLLLKLVSSLTFNEDETLVFVFNEQLNTLSLESLDNDSPNNRIISKSVIMK